MNALFRKILLVLTVACLVLTTTSGWVLADGFSAGTFSFEPRFGAFGTTYKRVDSIFTYGAAASYYVMDNVAVELEGMGAYVNQSQFVNWPNGYGTREKNAAGAGGSFNLRWNFVATSQAAMFLGGGVGGLWFDTKVPASKGSENNVTENAEIGAAYSLTQMFSLKGSLKYMHIGEFGTNSLSAFGGTVGVSLNF